MPGYNKPVPGYQNGGAPGMEQLDSIMMTGGPADVPMGAPGMGGGQPPMPPQGMPMGEDPMMALMGNEAALGEGGMERGMEAPISIEEDAGALAEAVVGRAEGDIGAAVAILDTAKAMLMSSGEQSMMEEPMMANMGRPLMRRGDQQPMMAAEGRYLSDRDLAPLTQSGRSLSDRDLAPLTQSGKSLSDKDRKMLIEMAMQQAQKGRTISDEDMDYFVDLGIGGMKRGDR